MPDYLDFFRFRRLTARERGASTLALGAILMGVGLVATAILAGTESITREPIAEAKRQELLRALMQVLPEGFDNQPEVDVVTLKDKRLNQKEKPVTFYRSRKGEANQGAAFVVVAPDGYSGDIEILMAVTVDGTISGMRIVAHTETPGLGDKVVVTDWPKSFVGRTLQNVKWGVKKDGGDFDQFAGATVTPRAVVKAVKKGLDFFVEKKEAVFQPGTVEKK